MGFSNGISEWIHAHDIPCPHCGAQYDGRTILQSWICVGCRKRFCDAYERYICEDCGSAPRCENCVTGLDEKICWPECQKKEEKEC